MMLKDDTVKKLTSIAMLLLLSVPAVADWYPSSNRCSAPSKPYKFTSQYAVDSYNADVTQFKKCISDFVDEQTKAVETHQAAASAAIDEWNQFARQN